MKVYMRGGGGGEKEKEEIEYVMNNIILKNEE